MSQQNDIYPVQVYSGTHYQAQLVKSILENSGIDVYLKDEYVGLLAPWNAAGGGAGAVKVIVSSEDAEKAFQIVMEFEENEKK